MVAVMAYVAALLNSMVGAVIEQRLIIVPVGLVTGGTLLLGLGLAGYFGDRLLRAAARRPAVPDSAPRPEPAGHVVLSQEGHVYWDGSHWRPVLQVSEDGHHVWNGQQWLPVRPSHPTQPPV
jgi:hypothetical protein